MLYKKCKVKGKNAYKISGYNDYLIIKYYESWKCIFNVYKTNLKYKVIHRALH